MTADLVPAGIDADTLDPTVPAPMTNVAEYGFEGRLEDWAGDARYFEYSKAANLAHLIPVQDAGLQTYLRSLDIRFSDRR
jgi:hypothetical protein